MKWRIPRLVHIFWAFAKLGGRVVLAKTIFRWPLKRVLAGPEQLKQLFEDLGGTFLKFGQMLALQPEFVPPQYAEALFDLMDRVRPFPIVEVRAIIHEELHSTPEELFDTFDSSPLATASIGQVHLATLHGCKYAVKVQRPGAEQQTMGDIRIMSAAVHIIERFGIRWLQWMVEPLREFVSWSAEELDYRNEARHSETVRERAREQSNVVVPKVIWEMSTRRVLVAEFLEGVTVIDYLREVENPERDISAKIGALGFDAQRFSQNLIENFVGCAFKHGIFHADMHPANLMILSDNRVGYIDFGITGQLSRQTRKALVSLTLAYSKGSLDEMIDQFLQVSSYGKSPDEAAFRNGIYESAASWYSRSDGTVKLQSSISVVMLDMLILSKDAEIWPQKDVIKYIRSAITLDGLITRVSPGFQVGDSLETVCEAYLRWGAWSDLLSYDRWINFSSRAGFLAMNAPARLERATDRLLEVMKDQAPKKGRDVQWSAPPTSSLWLGGVIFLVALLLSPQPGEMAIGLNFATIAVGLVFMSGFLLVIKTIFPPTSL